MPKVLLVLGSNSDLPLFGDALKLWPALGIEVQVEISSAHRSPQRTLELATGAPGQGIEVIIAGAGGAAHLAGVIAAHTILPVIGVPINVPPFNGFDSLLAMAQMPKGVPVATLAAGEFGATNSAILSAQILALKYPQIQGKLTRLKEIMEQNVAFKIDAVLAGLG
ncbi:MAG: 5-(carboxyamino)imidazole ribonucleotide mutase [Candidatus Schekmanbacteria bacterium]|nr:5-(carboxyamino)imidazole ribonucleotide mutase [Candidatus Schekmanbacteria bacterium]